jgi:hypothetical protein
MGEASSSASPSKKQQISTLEKTVTKAKKASAKEKSKPSPKAWISMRTGIGIITVTSIGMAVLTAWEVIPQRGWGEGILWGLLFGVLIWVIFFGMLAFNRFVRR